jgi:site-specific recombinase XerD
MTTSLATIPTGTKSLVPIVEAWARTCTDLESSAAAHLLRDKREAVLSFFRHAGKPPAECTTQNALDWIMDMEAGGLKQATIYARASRVSAFYKWVAANSGNAVMVYNPIEAVRPKAPKPYQSEKTKALSDEEMTRLVRLVKYAAENENNPRKRLTYLRDYAMLVMLFASGLRINEVMQLKWGKTQTTPAGLQIETRVKGGELRHIEINQVLVREALMYYIGESGRADSMKSDSPLWLGHAPQGNSSEAGLSARSFSYNMKRYGRMIGRPDLHNHMTRHTYARIIADETGSLTDTQDALGHANARTTKHYMQRLGVKRDKNSDKIMKRMGLS